MKLGVIIPMEPVNRLDEELSRLTSMGFSACQLCCWNEGLFTDENAETVKALIERHGVEVETFWCGWDGPCEWNLVSGPATIGLVPTAYRYKRLDILKKGSDFIKKIGIPNIITHVGFIPINPYDPEYIGLLGALRDLANHCKRNGQSFLFETGQETPVTLLRAIEDIGMDNVGINLDPANILLYGMGNPVDALDVFGGYVRCLHAKDGLCPTTGRELGLETPVGEGKVNFPVLIDKLMALGFDGHVIIEREISGQKQIEDIIASKAYLEKLIGG